MGQLQSGISTAAEATAQDSQGGSSSASTSAANNHSLSPSLDSLIAEAAAFGEEAENKSLEAKAQQALECPCIAHLRTGPCGAQFSDSFLCFLKSTAEEKGSDCVTPFVALQECIKTNPKAFSKDVLESEEIKKAEQPVQEYKMYPPLWSVESRKSKKPKT